MPSTGGLSIEVRPTFRDLQGKFARADKALLDAKREGMRSLGRQWVAIARDEAPKGKTGKFAKSIAFRTFESGSTVGFNTYSAMPLGRFIREGTKAHKIAAKSKKALYFFFGKAGMYAVVPKGGGFKTHVRGGKLWIGKGYVQHPGTRANPYHTRATARWMTLADMELRRMSLRYSATLTGGS